MLDFLSTSMGFKTCAPKHQPSQDDHEFFYSAREFQDLYSQYKELEEINDPTYLYPTKCIVVMHHKFEKNDREEDFIITWIFLKAFTCL